MDGGKALTLEATLENIPQVTAFVEQALGAMDCPPKAQMQLSIAIDELFSNIARYAYAPGIGAATVRIQAAEDPKGVILTFLDKGVPFDPTATADPDLTLDIMDRPIGGLGIHMVKQSMDRMEYRYADGQNILTIQKHF